MEDLGDIAEALDEICDGLREHPLPELPRVNSKTFASILSSYELAILVQSNSSSIHGLAGLTRRMRDRWLELEEEKANAD